MKHWRHLVLVAVLVLVPGTPATPSHGAGRPAPASPPVAVELVGHLGDDAQGIFVAGDYAYAALGRELAVLDIADPAHPVRVGWIPLPQRGGRVHVAGGYAYVTGEYADLYVIDVANPAQPELVTSYTTPAMGLYVAGSYAYLVSRYGAGDQFKVLDVSDPAHPVLAGSCGTEGIDVHVVGNYAYVAGGNEGAGLRVVDVSNPAAPVEMGSLAASAVGVYAAGQYAYVADHTLALRSRLLVVDVSDPGNPQQVGEADLFGFYGPWGGLGDVDVASGYAYIAGSMMLFGGDVLGGIDIVDVSDPGNPQLRELCVWSGVTEPYQVVAAGPYAFLTAGYAGLRVIDVADPNNPTGAGAFPVVNSYDDEIALSGHYAYLADGGLDIVDIADPTNPVFAGRYEPDYGAQAGPGRSPASAAVDGLALSGPYAYLTVYGGLRVVDVSDPAHPSAVGSYQAAAVDVAVAGNVACLAGTPDDLVLLDISNPAQPTRVGDYDAPGEALAVGASGSVAYLGTQFGLWIVDISDPAHPAEVGSCQVAGNVQSIHVAGDYAYLATFDSQNILSTLWIADISDPANPGTAGSCQVSGWASSIHVAGDYAYVGGDDLWIVDISEPTAPVLAATYAAEWDLSAGGAAAAGDYVYATIDGLRVLRVAPVALEIAPSGVTMLAQAGGDDPPPRHLDVDSTGGVLTWTAALSPTVGWLAVAPLSGTTPARITVTAHISGVSVGDYTTRLVVAGAPGVGGSPQVVPVRLLVVAEVQDVYLPVMERRVP